MAGLATSPPPTVAADTFHGRTGARAFTALRAALPLVMLTGLGLAVRLQVFRGIWVDEAISVHQAEQPFAKMIHELRYGDRLPPLHDAVLWLSLRLFGHGELAVRGPSIVAGTLLVPVMYAAARDLFDRRTGLMAAALGAIAPALVWYSQEARPYAFFMLFATAAVWAQIRVLRRGGFGGWLLYALATGALLWTHYFGVLVVGVQQLAYAAVAWRRARGGLPVRRLVIGCAITSLVLVAVLAPLVPMMRDQFAVNQAVGMGFQDAPARSAAAVGQQGQGLSVYGFLANFVWALWGYHSDATMTKIAALWPLAMLLVLTLLGRGQSRRTTYLAALALVPALLLFGIGFVKRDLFELRYFIASVPVLLLLCARAVTSWSSGRVAQIAIGGVLAATLIAGFADQQLNTSNPRQFDFRGTLQKVNAIARPGDVLVYQPSYLYDVVNYYSPGIRSQRLGAGLPEPVRGRRVIVLGSFLDQPGVARAVGGAVGKLRYHHRQVTHVADPGIQAWVFR